MKANLCSVLAAMASVGLAQPAAADVITDRTRRLWPMCSATSWGHRRRSGS